MQAVEFDSYVKDGVITIPSQYQKEIARSVRVIVLSKEETPSVSQDVATKKDLYYLAVDMTGFTFDRNEINER